MTDRSVEGNLFEGLIAAAVPIVSGNVLQSVLEPVDLVTENTAFVFPTGARNFDGGRRSCAPLFMPLTVVGLSPQRQPGVVAWGSLASRLF